MADTDSRPDTETSPSPRLGRVIFRAWRRGFREADLVLGPFAEQVGPTLDDAELDAFEVLLDQDDNDLYGWIIGREPTPEGFAGPVMDKVQAFMRAHVAAAVAEGAG